MKHLLIRELCILRACERRLREAIKLRSQLKDSHPRTLLLTHSAISLLLIHFLRLTHQRGRITKWKMAPRVSPHRNLTLLSPLGIIEVVIRPCLRRRILLRGRATDTLGSSVEHCLGVLLGGLVGGHGCGWRRNSALLLLFLFFPRC